MPARVVPGGPDEWLSFARSDLALARIRKPRGGSWESLCFHAQQAAEKAVKAVYQAYGWPFRYTHDLRELLEGLESKGFVIPKRLRELPTLTRYAWESCYPGASEKIGGEHRQRAVKLAEKTVAWAEAELEKARGGALF